MNYLDLTIKELHEALVKKEVTPLELTKEAIKRAKEDTNNAFETILEDEAIRIASNLIEPEEDNIFWGIPIGIKDNFSTKGILTTASSEILKDYVPVFDATVVERLLKAKAVPIAKTCLDELAMGGTGTTGHKGITYNPFDKKHERLAGGSSCGSAAMVSAGIAPFALGSDTGDSVRKPASYVGLVGFKPTWGRISRFGLFPFAPSLDHVAYFTRSVEDAALTLPVLAGRDFKDATSSNEPVENYAEGINNSINGKRIAVLKEVIDSIHDDKTLELFNKTIENLKEKGAIVKTVSFDLNLLEAIYPTYMVISCAEATSNNANLDGIKFGPRHGGDTYQEVMNNARTIGFCELIRRRFIIGSFSLMRENQNDLFLRAQKARRLIVNKTNEILENYDFIYIPAAPGIAPKFTDSSDKLSTNYLIADNILVLGNFAGLPSITLPVGLIDNMPVGANLMGKKFQEKALFNVAKAIEDGTGLYNLSSRKLVK
ncbi:MAG: Asp-tRNA(Asn)/Glu-tRNA(Gln) amidotransferase subunit GatA [Erysipelotrichales bacterium]|nr:Asp-tRNA(Asn)/Glu-tRNA(Gln) amidotransferase subunit GatA [Erysipelotrichales bacterium]